MTTTEKRERLVDLLEDFETGMLVTQSAAGGLRSRPMHLARSLDDGTMYFATGADSAKVDEVRSHPEVNVVFQNDHQYLSLTGKADLVQDRALIDELYSPAWKVWFPEGRDDPQLRILKVDADRGEYWDVGGGGQVRFLYEAGKALVKGEEMDYMDDEHHGKVEL